MAKKVLVKFNYNSNPVVFTVPEGHVFDLTYMRDVEWVSSVDGVNYFTGNAPEPVTVTETKLVMPSEFVTRKITELIRYGNPLTPADSRHPSKIMAIKVVRDETNCTLKEAKDLVDRFTSVINPNYPSRYDPEFSLSSYDEGYDPFTEPPF